MNDSAKLRFIYGVLLLIGSFLCFGIDISFIFLLIFVKIPENIITPLIMLLIFLFFAFICLITSSVSNFMATGIINAKENDKNQHTIDN
ncbi:MAG: hypothetical protein IJE05_06345 [Clostridia bacterium]|nr:hypothetical protein [Clostridia bacterium]